MLANLFAMRSYKTSPEIPDWQNDYLCGTGMEMYTEHLSPAFTGMTFAEAAELCFVKLKLLLLAVEMDTAHVIQSHGGTGHGATTGHSQGFGSTGFHPDSGGTSAGPGGSTIVINPKGNVRLPANTQGSSFL